MANGIKQIGSQWNPYLQAYVKSFIVDTESDIVNLPECAPSSDAIAVQEGTVFMVNASGEWAKFGGV